jgi:hypothetical protein
MEAQSGHKPWWLYFLRWGARIAALSLFAFLFKDFLRVHLWDRDLPHGMIRFPPFENIFIIYFIAFFVGLWREWLGG